MDRNRKRQEEAAAAAAERETKTLKGGEKGGKLEH